MKGLSITSEQKRSQQPLDEVSIVSQYELADDVEFLVFTLQGWVFKLHRALPPPHQQ